MRLHRGTFKQALVTRTERKRERTESRERAEGSLVE